MIYSDVATDVDLSKSDIYGQIHCTPSGQTTVRDTQLNSGIHTFPGRPQYKPTIGLVSSSWPQYATYLRTRFSYFLIYFLISFVSLVFDFAFGIWRLELFGAAPNPVYGAYRRDQSWTCGFGAI